MKIKILIMLLLLIPIALAVRDPEIYYTFDTGDIIGDQVQNTMGSYCHASNNGALTGNTTCMDGTCIHLDGNDDVIAVNCSETQFLDDSIGTLNFWIYTDTITSLDGLYACLKGAHYQAWLLENDNEGNPYLYYTDGVTTKELKNETSTPLGSF